MPEFERRPKIRNVKFTIKEAGETKDVSGPDLNDIIRGVVIDLRNAWGLSTRQLAFRLGLSQNTLSGFIDSELDQGTRLETLTRICASLDVTPGELFDLHPQFEEKVSSDRAWAMIRNSLPEETVSQLLEAVLVGKQMNVLPGLIANLNEMVKGLAKSQSIDIRGAAREAKAISASG